MVKLSWLKPSWSKALRKTVHVSAVAALLGFAAFVPQALADDPVFMENDGSGGYWTPGRLMRAKSLDMPVASEAMLTEPADELPSLVDGQVWGYGAYPAEGHQIAPDLEARIHPELASSDSELEDVAAFELADAEAEFVEPSDVGTSGAHFSSSRLVPADSRLFYPYSTVGKLFFVKPGVGPFECSAAVVRPRLVLTAGHCVHSGSGGNSGFFSNFLFVPAFHSGQAPFQAWDWSFVVTTVSWAGSNGSVPIRVTSGSLWFRISASVGS
jgi:hypothetical protein